MYSKSVTRANFIFLATSIYRTIGGGNKLTSKVAKCNREVIPAGHTSTSDFNLGNESFHQILRNDKMLKRKELFIGKNRRLLGTMVRAGLILLELRHTKGLFGTLRLLRLHPPKYSM